MNSRKIDQLVEVCGVILSVTLVISMIALRILGMLHFDLADILVVMFAGSVGFSILGSNLQEDGHQKCHSQDKSILTE